MNEGKVTKNLIRFLKNNGWNVVAFDYPQSGTGRNFRPSKEFQEENNKNKNHVIPDILAVKDGVLLFFENKTEFFFNDFKKVNGLRINNIYEDSINEFLGSLNIKIHKMYFGIGCRDSSKFYKKAEMYYHMTDFVLNVNEQGVEVTYNSMNINFKT